jgi:glyoxylase-like metal-dependent hydrolase (beta-lactamase superfamily II)
MHGRLAARDGGTPVKDDLVLIDLDQPREGYRKFLSSWVGGGKNLTFVVDPGPRSTAAYLVAELARRGVTRVDYVLLTHIHLDHGGCAAELLAAFPEARLYCHPAGVKHVVDPAQLWKGSLTVLGEVAEMYGAPSPVAAARIATEEELADVGFEVLMTPGHAVHHVSYVRGETLFVGEAFGTRSPLKSGALYMRPATPARFFLDQALASLDSLLALPSEPALTAFAHYGSAPGAFAYAAAARKQLLLWVETAREAKAVAKSRGELDDRVFARLQEIDPVYGQGRFDELDPDIQKRERHFLANSLDGILGWLDG